MLFPSTLIVFSATKDLDIQLKDLANQVGHKINPNNPDIFSINSNSGYSIDIIRQTKHFLSNKPFSHQTKIVLIHDAHKLLIEAQNALLKILEEPGKENYIFLTSSKPLFLLPTILSRCHTIRLAPDSLTGDIKPIFNKIDLNLSEELSKDKITVLPQLEKQLIAYHQLLVSDPNPITVRIIEKIIKAIQMINVNVDPKSAIDYLMLS